MKKRDDLVEDLMNCYLAGVLAGFCQTRTQVRLKFTPYTTTNAKNRVQQYITKTYTKATFVELDVFDNAIIVTYPEDFDAL